MTPSSSFPWVNRNMWSLGQLTMISASYGSAVPKSTCVCRRCGPYDSEGSNHITEALASGVAINMCCSPSLYLLMDGVGQDLDSRCQPIQCTNQWARGIADNIPVRSDNWITAVSKLCSSTAVRPRFVAFQSLNVESNIALEIFRIEVSFKVAIVLSASW